MEDLFVLSWDALRSGATDRATQIASVLYTVLALALVRASKTGWQAFQASRQRKADEARKARQAEIEAKKPTELGLEILAELRAPTARPRVEGSRWVIPRRLAIDVKDRRVWVCLQGVQATPTDPGEEFTSRVKPWELEQILTLAMADHWQTVKCEQEARDTRAVEVLRAGRSAEPPTVDLTLEEVESLKKGGQPRKNGKVVFAFPD